MSASALKQFTPRLCLAAAARPCRVASMSTWPAPKAPPAPAERPASDPSASESELPYIFSNFAAPPQYQQPADSSRPPAAPRGAYPPPVNPLTYARRSVIENLNREKPTYGVYVQSTPNNTIVTLTRPGGNPLLTLSGGKVGYKGAQKSSFEACSKCAVGIFERLAQEQEKGDLKWELFLSGFGTGRDAFHKTMLAVDPSIKVALLRITDRTPIKIGGTRAKKAKRR